MYKYIYISHVIKSILLNYITSFWYFALTFKIYQ